MTPYLVIFITVGNKKRARLIADRLVEEKLAACVNIVKNVESCFCWQGKTGQASECLLIVKSRKMLFPALKDRVKQLHDYDVPEILALPVLEGNEEYLTWIEQSTQ